MRISSLMDAVDELQKRHPVAVERGNHRIEHGDVAHAREKLREYVLDLLSKAQRYSDPSDHGYQQIILELTYFNTRSLIGK